MSTHSFPDPVFESLLDKLVRALEITQRSESTLNPQVRQALYQATTEFKDGLAKAKQVAEVLPGGELVLDEQKDVIAMLEQLRDMKSAQLAHFSSKPLSTSSKVDVTTIKMEIDSTASSPQD